LFVLDNSLRESTVGQVRGHTLDDKLSIIDAVKSCGIQHIIIAALNGNRRVDDALAENLKERGDDMSCYYAFTEDSDKVEAGKMLWGPDHLPIAMQKMEKYGIQNPIIEIDFADKSVDWAVFELMPMLTFLLTYSRDKLSCRGGAFVNVRDWPLSMQSCPERVKQCIQGLRDLPGDIRPQGILVEEPMGLFFADEVGGWTQQTRDWMGSWGHLVVHVHKQWGLGDAVVLDALALGADGIWCSLCEEGAAMGHACSAVTLANLARLGNAKVAKKYHTAKLGNAARIVTRATTGRGPDMRQIVYGPRAIEVVFDFGGIAGGQVVDTNNDGKLDKIDKFDLAEFLGLEKAPIRISTLSSEKLVCERLINLFGSHETFTEETAAAMKQMMLEDLHAGRKEDYTSPIGLAMLYGRVHGEPTPSMCKTANDLSQGKLTPLQDALLKDAEACFREHAGDDMSIDYWGFYHAFAQPYFGCFTCETTQGIMDVIDRDDDGKVEWCEWRFWCIWALRQYGAEITTVDDVHHTIFRHALMPLMLDRDAQGQA